MRLRLMALLPAFMIIAPSSARAQAEFGVLGGVTFGNISNKGVLPGNLSTRTGFAGGGYVGYRFGVFGVGAEAMYAQRGLKSDESIATADTKLDYVDIPAYIKVNIPVPGVRPYAYLGPQVSFEVGCASSDGAACSNPNRKKTDFAGLIGAGVRFGPDNIGVGVEARYVYGLTDLNLNTVSNAESYKNRTFMILVRIGK